MAEEGIKVAIVVSLVIDRLVKESIYLLIKAVRKFDGKVWNPIYCLNNSFGAFLALESFYVMVRNDVGHSCTNHMDQGLSRPT